MPAPYVLPPAIVRPARTKRAAIAVLALAGALNGCTNLTLGGASPHATAPDVVERSSVRLGKIPQEAAACIVENARSAGQFGELVPLYGMESVAVTVKTRTAGDIMAVFSLMREDQGSVASTTTWAGVADRETLVQSLVRGC